MRSYAPTCTPDKAGYAVRLPFCLPQNGRGSWFLPIFEIEPTTDLLSPTSSFCEADSFCIKGIALLLVTMIVGPGVLGPDDLGSDAEGAVEVLGLRFGVAALRMRSMDPSSVGRTTVQ